jgi:hypothetical protein
MESGRRDADGARVTHHQDAKAGEDGAFHIDLPGAKPGTGEPADDGEPSDPKNGRRVDAQHAVHQMEETGLQCPRVLYMADHLIQKAAFADCSDLHQEGAIAVDRTPDDHIAIGLLHRNCFTGHQRLIDTRMATGHDAIGRDALAGANAHEITDIHVLDRQFQLFFAAHDARCLGLQVQETLHRLGTPRLDSHSEKMW